MNESWRDSIAAIGVTIIVMLFVVAAFVQGQNSREVRTNIPIQPTIPSCYEDEAIIWHNNAHSLCVPIDNIVDTGIENAIQMGVLEYTE